MRFDRALLASSLAILAAACGGGSNGPPDGAGTLEQASREQADACTCYTVDAPVCGSDGNTYGNDCEARCAGVDVVHDGPCDTTTEPPVVPGEGTVCTTEWEPVCGEDGETYGNRCEAKRAGVDVAYDGECRDCPGDSVCFTVVDPACGVDGRTYSNACVAKYQRCVEIDHLGACCTEGPCLDCPQDETPVCGVNGTTYKNACIAGVEGVAVDHDGSCMNWH